MISIRILLPFQKPFFFCDQISVTMSVKIFREDETTFYFATPCLHFMLTCSSSSSISVLSYRGNQLLVWNKQHRTSICIQERETTSLLNTHVASLLLWFQLLLFTRQTKALREKQTYTVTLWQQNNTRDFIQSKKQVQKYVRLGAGYNTLT